ncbi:MAG TPA: sigma-E factor negative regulatory protein [Woeseiaceae bacterium]|nr:sigma-E factor negative regulatory protein [Woeseiaceae bacterium]
MQVSAFVDGELAENETELLLRRLSQDAALRQLVAQYLRIGRAVRGEREISGMSDLRGRIANALGEEQPTETVAAAGRSPSRWLRPVAGVAVAATVAGLALVSLQRLEVDNSARPEAAVAGGATAEVGYTEPSPSDALSQRPASETLRQYYVRHGETSSDLGPNGILTRFVTLELRRGELVEIEPEAAMTTPIDAPAGDPEASDGSDDDEQPEQTP